MHRRNGDLATPCLRRQAGTARHVAAPAKQDAGH